MKQCPLCDSEFVQPKPPKAEQAYCSYRCHVQGTRPVTVDEVAAVLIGDGTIPTPYALAERVLTKFEVTRKDAA